MKPNLDEPLVRHPGNPILTAHQVNAVWREPHLRVVTVHNAGVARVGAETVLLFRSHLRSGISVIGLARSTDGIGGWRIEPRPVGLLSGRGNSAEAGRSHPAVRSLAFSS